MKLDDLIALLQRRINTLQQQHNAAMLVGDIDAITRCETEIAQTQETLNQMLSIGA